MTLPGDRFALLVEIVVFLDIVAILVTWRAPRHNGALLVVWNKRKMLFITADLISYVVSWTEKYIELVLVLQPTYACESTKWPNLSQKNGE
jgi:hypothetical protein